MVALSVPIKSSIDARDLTVGDKFVLTTEAPSDVKIEPAPLERMLGDATVLSPLVKAKKTRMGNDVYACTLAIYKPGEAKIPTPVFRSAGDTTTFSGDTITVNVVSVLPPDTTKLQVADIRGPRKLRGPLWPYFLGALLIALIVSSVIIIRNKLRRHVTQLVAPPIPPWELAFKQLDELKAARHLEFGRFKQFYFELSMIVRAYIEKRYETPAVESTTFELENDGRIMEIDSGLRSRLFDLFYRADPVKFAKSIPEIREAQSDLSFAYDFVVGTKPVIVPQESQEKAQEVAA
jgi:hypothetical protein